MALFGFTDEIKFNCPTCDQPLDADADLAGESIECPQCKNALVVPTPVSPPTELPIDKHKQCPFCAEKILVDARKCRYCGEFVDASERPPATPLTRALSTKVVAGKPQEGLFLQTMNAGCAFILIVIAVLVVLAIAPGC